MKTPKHGKFKVDQVVSITDTANGRLREGKVTAVHGTTVEVFVERFQRIFTFVRGETNLGRFTLDGW